MHGLNEFGISGPERVLHGISETMREAVPGIGGLVAWFVTAGVSAVVGVIAGAATALIVMPVMGMVKRI